MQYDDTEERLARVERLAAEINQQADTPVESAGTILADSTLRHSTRQIPSGADGLPRYQTHHTRTAV
jgi:hypothetical protein